MLSPDLFTFLQQIKENNNREWFHSNKSFYDKVREEFLDFCNNLLVKLQKLDPSLKEIQVRDVVFRFNRDTRFSSDKSPYKKNFAAAFSKGGRKSDYAGYYIHLEPGNSYIGGGMWMPETAFLNAVRQEIDYNQEEFLSIITNKNFKRTFGSLSETDKLKTIPKNFSKDHPLIEILKLKSFIAEQEVAEKEVFDPNFSKTVTKIFKDLKPLNDFLNRAID